MVVVVERQLAQSYDGQNDVVVVADVVVEDVVVVEDGLVVIAFVVIVETLDV